MADDLPADVAKLLDPTMESETFDTATIGGATYYFIDQFDDVDGEPVIVRQAPGKAPEAVDDILPEDDATGGAASELSEKLQERLRAIRGTDFDDAGGDVGGGGSLTQQQVNERLNRQAGHCADGNHSDHLISKNAPGTNNGRLACAWAVNQVANMALGRQIGGGLATANMVLVLRQKHGSIETPVPGCVIISPTVSTPHGRNIGHVGIVGNVSSGNLEDTKIYSNSSSRGQFEQNFSYGAWLSRYRDTKHLSVELFQLAPSAFPSATS